MRLALFVLIAMALNGCSGKGSGPQPVMRPSTATTVAGDESAQGSRWPAEVKFHKLDTPPGYEHDQLQLAISTRLPDAEPTTSVSGTLTVTDSKGAKLYEDTIIFSDDVSFTKVASHTLTIEYDASNANHLALRQDKNLKATFKPLLLLYADGKEKSF